MLGWDVMLIISGPAATKELNEEVLTVWEDLKT